jgi:hypothetical protein
MLRDVVALLLLAVLCSAAWAKTGRTYFTEARIAAARDNVARHEWAQGLRDRILKHGDTLRYYIGPIYTSADAYSAQSDEFLWLLQPTTELPRTYDVGRDPTALCPVHGAAVGRFDSFNPWRIDPLTHPYQVQCPVGGEWYPSNRHDQGDLTSGDFPDDGSGCLYQGHRYHFLAEYAHMVYGSVVVPTLTSLSQAYVLTEDPRYAHAGCLLLARLATQYPNYGWEGTSYPDLEDRTARTYLQGGYHPHYTWKNGGMISDLIWECFLTERIAYAYDGLYPFFDDPAVLSFVRDQGMPVQTGDELRRYIEDYILRAAMVGLQRKMIHGNEGHHQACALTLALVLDDTSDRHPSSVDMAEYAYHGIGAAADLLTNGLTRDGGGHESPGYNTIKLDFIRVAQRMEELRALHPALFPLERYPDLFAEPKARELFTHFIDLLMLDRFLPPIGDNSALLRPERMREAWRRHSFVGAENLFAFGRYGDPRFARAATQPDGTREPGDLWEPYPEAELQAALADPASEIRRTSRLLDGYGVAILESGEWPHNRALALNYTSTIGHRQNDQLAIWLYARGLELLPDLGYPRTWEHRVTWDAANLAHNTVTVNERPFAARFFQNGCRLFASEGGVHVVNAWHNPYPQGTSWGQTAELPCDLYERTVVMLDLDPDRFYVVDLFAVNGGEQHDQSWHGMYVPPEVPALEWQAQEGGTLAGPDVAEFAPYTDRWGQAYPQGNTPCFITEVKRAPLAQPAAWTWRSGLPEADAVALHVVPVDGPLEAVMGQGRSPVWADEEKLHYLFVRRQVADGAATRFLTVLDSYQGIPTVDRVRLLANDPLTLEVVRSDGVDEVTVHLPPGPTRSTAHRALGVRVVTRQGETVTRDVRVGDLGRGEPGYAAGTVAEVDYARNQVLLPGEGLRVEDFGAGRAIRLYSDMRSAMFRVTACEATGRGFRVMLDKPPLLARLAVTGVSNGRLVLRSPTPFTTGQLDPATARPLEGADDAYHGAWLGEGAAARRLLGITHGPPEVYAHLAEPVPDETLEADYLGRAVPIWYYGAGDSFEVARGR